MGKLKDLSSCLSLAFMPLGVVGPDVCPFLSFVYLQFAQLISCFFLKNLGSTLGYGFKNLGSTLAMVLRILARLWGTSNAPFGVVLLRILARLWAMVLRILA